MDSIQLVRKFWQLFNEQRWDDARKLLSLDFIAEWPQSRERMVGSGNFIEVNRNYPGNHKIDVIHAHGFADRVITTVWIEADTGQKTYATSYFGIKGGKIARVEEYWAEPYPAPEGRRKWIELY